MDKPAGPTSHDVVARARRLFATRSVGHTGTLDPFATGLLVLVFGAATRLARWAGGERHRKTYRAVIRLGQVTSTDDCTGVIVTERTVAEWPSAEAVGRALAAHTGPFQQRPPAYSAKRVGGVRSYRLARRGAAPEPAAVLVTVYRLELLEYQPPLVTVRAEVGPGTYLRALGRDLGEALGTGAHLTELRRERIGPWNVADAVPLDRLTGSESLLPAESLVRDLPGVSLAPEEVVAVGHGRDVIRPDLTGEREGEGEGGGEAALYDGERLVAIARAIPGGWHPAVVLTTGEAAPR